MTDTDPGHYGAKRATWRKTNPRELLDRIITRNKIADEKQWREMFWDEVKDDEDQLYAIVQYWFDNAIRAVLPAESRLRSKVKTGPRDDVKEKLVAVVKKEAKLLLLELVMPNGKPLAECTGQDCRHFGGWIAKLAETVPAKSRVGDVLNEKQVRKLWNSTI